MGVYVQSSEILRKLNLRMPVSVSLPDPLTGEPIEVKRENLLALLVIDSASLLVEGQSVAALYAEMARMQRAAQWAQSRAEIQFKQWHAAIAQDFRAARNKEKGKPPTVGEVEEAVRLHKDYKKHATAPEHFEAVAGLFEDIKRAFDMKSRILRDQASMMMGHERARRADTDQRLDEMENAEEFLAESMATAAIPHKQ